jgi:hypothetical protein
MCKAACLLFFDFVGLRDKADVTRGACTLVSVHSEYSLKLFQALLTVIPII